MGMEIERKFLIVADTWRSLAEGTFFRQGYLNSSKERTVRVRTMGTRAALTIKGLATGAVRQEFEYEIPFSDAKELLELCEQPLIEKTRYRIPHEGLVWEVDEFHGLNEGLIVAECELESADQADQDMNKPDWVGEEVTGDSRYFNSSLITKPFSDWK
ncbi:MAG: CYTH domain-containing protein [Gemmatimonadales bacterium]|nr:CYTH domain-containing protein [Gemmatimonadales bacterium]